MLDQTAVLKMALCSLNCTPGLMKLANCLASRCLPFYSVSQKNRCVWCPTRFIADHWPLPGNCCFTMNSEDQNVEAADILVLIPTFYFLFRPLYHFLCQGWTLGHWSPVALLLCFKELLKSLSDKDITLAGSLVCASQPLELELGHQDSLIGAGWTNWRLRDRALGAGCGLEWPRCFQWCSWWSPCYGLCCLLLSFMFLLMAC